MYNVHEHVFNVLLILCIIVTQVRLQSELSQLESDIANKESELQTLLPRYQQQRDQEERLTARLKACEQRRSELFAKQGRVQQFSTRQNRDKWINKEITSLQQSAAQKEQQVSLSSCSTCIYLLGLGRRWENGLRSFVSKNERRFEGSHVFLSMLVLP